MKKLLLLIPVLLIAGIFFYACQQDTNVVEPTTNAVLYSVGCIDDNPTIPVGIIPTKELFPGGEPVCAPGKRLTPGDGAETITFNLDGITGNDVTVVITVPGGDDGCGEVMAWSVPDNIVIDKVYVKGGTTQNVYDYTSTSPRPSNDGGLHSPVNESGKYAGISHVDFCFHYKLEASKTAVPKFTRTYSWTIDKVGDVSELTLSAGQTHTVNYDVKLDATYLDSDWMVNGTITIENNTPFDAEITSISDVLTGGITANYDCGVTLPYTLAKGAKLECTYSADLASASNGTNTVTVVTNSTNVTGDVATADYTFGDPTTEVDECINVSDTYAGTLGTVCFAAAPYTFEYQREIVYNECGEFQVDNTASFITNDGGVTGSDAWNVIVTIVDCDGGCTLTPGYWKTHSTYGPAPYDDNWANLGENTTFFQSGQSYYQVLWTAPAGNPYYILAHAYIAARLNFLNGADPSAAQTAFDAATGLFNTYTPAQVAAMKANNNIKQQFVALAMILDNYNNGLIGPGHCDE